MRLSKLGVLGTLVAVACAALAVSATAGTDSDTKVYLVQLADKPAIAYAGGVPGYAATKPAKGQRIDRDSADVEKYVGYLRSKQDKALEQVGGAKKGSSVVYVANGFSAALTAAQAEALAGTKGVVSVEEDVPLQLDTSDTPAFLGLTGPDGGWAKLGGQGKAGEDVVVGMIDSGIWPENPSVADKVKGKGQENQNYDNVFRAHMWKGKCQAGEAFTAADCNKKLIGAQYFADTQELAGRLPAADAAGFISPRDSNGHGTHTATTAAGNGGVSVDGDAAAAGFDKVSGMAPRARLAIYKACFDDGDPATGDCFQGDTAAAIDQATTDGVDVINFSISGTRTDYLNLVEVAFLNAAANGVFVAASAGNDNFIDGQPGPTVAHPSPWVTTVAASTHPRYGEGTVTVKKADGTSKTYSGASMAAPVGPAALIYAGDAAPAGATATQIANAKLCVLGTLDGAKVAGKIVACDRGVNDRTDKSLEVKNKGGVGMILLNPTANSINADLHFVPTVHVQNTDGDEIRAAAQAGGATAAIAQSVRKTVDAPFMASFSSRGPSQASGDQLKPDVTAPGVDILAGYSPATASRRNYNVITGTSMSSPHVAGLGALVRQAHPDWSPMAIKSALMTTAYNVKDVFAATTATAATSNHPGNPNASSDAVRLFAQGAGHVDPTKALDPGLVYDSNVNDWIGFLCGVGRLSGCSAEETIDPSDLNLASIAIGDLAGAQTVTRTVTNVSGKSVTFTSAVTGLNGISVVVSPSSFTIAPGGTQTYTVSFTRTTADLAKYQGGFLTWTGGGYSVRSPVVVQPVRFQAPTEVSGSGATSSVTYNTKSGYTGNLSYSIRGLQAATTFANHVGSDPDCNFDTVHPEAMVAAGKATVSEFTTPSDTSYIRFQTFQSDTDAAGHDLDMYVYRKNVSPADAPYVPIGASGGPNANEVVNTTSAGSLAAGAKFKVYIHGCSVEAGGSNFTLFAWAITGSSSNPFSSVPASQVVTIGQVIPTTFGWSGLPAANRYLGRVIYVDSTTPPGVAMAATVIAVSTR